MPESSSSVRFAGVTSSPKDVSADVLFVPVFQGSDRLEDCPGLEAATSDELARALSSGEFHAKLGETLTAAASGWATRRVVFAGGGSRADLDTERIRRIASTCGYVARRRSATSMAVLARGLDPGVLADGLSAAEFDSGVYKSDTDAAGRYPARVDVVVPGGDAGAVTEQVRKGRIIGESVNFDAQPRERTGQCADAA